MNFQIDESSLPEEGATAIVDGEETADLEPGPEMEKNLLEEAYLKELKSWVIWLGIIGISQLLIPGLDKGWGIILFILAATCHFSRRPQLLIILGCTLIFSGISNMIGDISGWSAFGLFQLGLGGYQLYNFRKFKNVYALPVESGEADQPGAKRGKYDWFALSSFLGGLATALAAFITFIYIVYVFDLAGVLTPGQEEALNFVFSLIIGGSFLGISAGIASFFIPHKKRIFSVLGIIINALVFLFLIY